MQFDERPIGMRGDNKGAPFQAMVSSSPADDFSNLPLEKLLQNHNWRARKEGYERVAQNITRYREGFFKSLVNLPPEHNIPALEALIKTAATLAKSANEAEFSVLSRALLSVILDKGITGRPNAVENSFYLISLLVENGSQEEVFELLIPAMSHKTPKNRMAAAQLCANLVHDYGVQSLPIKPILKAMQPLFNDSNPTVRKEAINLCCQCYRYIGAGIKNSLTDLRDVQLQELEQKFADVVVGGAHPKRIKGETQSNRNTVKAIAPVSSLARGEVNNDVTDDEYAKLNESPILSKLPKNFFKNALDKSIKWQDRSSLVSEALLPLLAAPRFSAKDDYHELSNMMKIYLVDPQAPLMLLGFKMVEACARGLRADFASYARSFLNPLFEKMKDKKSSVLEHVMGTLERLIRYHCITLDQCSDEMEQSSNSKNPSQRLAVINFCTRMVGKLDRSQYGKLSRSTDMLKRMVNDDKSANRDAAYLLLNKLIEVFDESSFASVLASMDDKQMSRMRTVVASNTTPSGSPAKKVLRLENALTSTSEAIVPADSKPSPQASSWKNTPPNSTSKASCATPSSRPQPTILDDGVALESTLPVKMDCVNTMLGLLNGDTTVLDQLRSNEWSQRHSGMLKVKAAVDVWTSAQLKRYFDVLVVYLRAYPGWKESIFQVFQILLATLEDALTRMRSVSLGAGYAIVDGCTPHLTEPKNQKLVRNILARIAEYLGWRFVFKHMLAAAAQVNTPKLLLGCNAYLQEHLETLPSAADGGDRGDGRETHAGKPGEIDVKGILEYLRRACFEQAAPPVRASALQVLAGLDRVVPGGVRAHLGAFPPAVRAAYEQEARRNGAVPPPSADRSPYSTPTLGPESASPPARDLQKPAAAAQKRTRTTSGPPSPGAKSPANPKLPRRQRGSKQGSQRQPSAASVEAAGNVPTSASSAGLDVPPRLRVLVQEISDGADWRGRIAAVHTLEEHLRQGGPDALPVNAVTPLLRALGERLDESNKNFVVDVLRVIALVVSVGDHVECKAGLRRLLPAATAMLGDQKVALREGARNVLFLGMDILGLDGMLPLLQKPLTADSNITRQNTLEAMQYGFVNLPADHTISRAVLQTLVPAIVNALMDRISEVRIAAEQVVGYAVPIVREDGFLRYINKLKPAERQIVLPAIERQIQIHNEATPRFYNNNSVHSEEVMPLLPMGTATSHSGGARTPYSATSSTSLRQGHPPLVRSNVVNIIKTEPPVLIISHKNNNNNTSSLSEDVFVSKTSAELSMPLTYEKNVSHIRNPKSSGTMQTTPKLKVHGSPIYPNKNNNSVSHGSSHNESQSTQSEAPAAGDQAGQSKWTYTMPEIVEGLRSATPSVAYAMCTDFMRHLRDGDDCGTPEMMMAMAERLHGNVKNFSLDLALGLIGCLRAIFISPRSAQRCHSGLLFRLLGIIFDCLLSESFSSQETGLKSLNSMTLKLLEGCSQNEVFSALLSKMTSYSATYLHTGQKNDLKYIQVTVKCIMRVDLEKVQSGNIILCCHEYLLQHPPSAFRELDDLPIRTVKTLLQSATRRWGPELLVVADKLVGSQNLVAHFIRACLDEHGRTQRSKDKNELQAAEENRKQQRASSTPPHNPENGSTAIAKKVVVSSAVAPPAASTPVPPPSIIAASPNVNPNAILNTTTAKTTPLRSGNPTHVDPAAPPEALTTLRTIVQPSALAEASPPPPLGKTTTPQKPPPSISSPSEKKSLSSAQSTSRVEKNGSSDFMASVFARIRNHLTTSQGIDELYSFLKQARSSTDYEEEFRHQLMRCSEAFRQYIKRKLERKQRDDSEKSPSFQLPQILKSL